MLPHQLLQAYSDNYHWTVYNSFLYTQWLPPVLSSIDLSEQDFGENNPRTKKEKKKKYKFFFHYYFYVSNRMLNVK